MIIFYVMHIECIACVRSTIIFKVTCVFPLFNNNIIAVTSNGVLDTNKIFRINYHAKIIKSLQNKPLFTSPFFLPWILTHTTSYIIFNQMMPCTFQVPTYKIQRMSTFSVTEPFLLIIQLSALTYDSRYVCAYLSF